MKQVKWIAAGVCLAVACGAQAGWKDPLPMGKEALVVKTAGGDVRIDPLAENLFRVRVTKDGVWTESGLNRYGILKRDWPAVKAERSPAAIKTAAAELAVDVATGGLRFRSAVSAADLDLGAKLVGEGFELRFPLADFPPHASK